MIIVEVYSPALDRSCDFQIDEGIRVSDAIRSFCDMIMKKSGDEGSGINGEFSLYEPEHKCVLIKEKTLRENNVSNGMKLILV